MKVIHRNLVAGVLEALEWSFGKNIYADKVLEQLFRQHKKWGKRDRAFVAEHTYTIVRNWRLLWELSGEEVRLKRKSLWKLFRVYAKWRNIELPQWDESEEDLADFPDSSKFPLAVRESYPDWFDQLAESEIGDEWHGIAQEMNREALLVLRTNTLRIDRESLFDILHLEYLDPKPLPWNAEGFYLEQRVSTQRLKSFQDGLFEVQDGGSQRIAPLLDVHSGMSVIDACAGAGGKSLHLASMMKNEGNIIAMDVEGRKLKELEKRALHQGVGIISTELISTKVLKSLEESADRLLLDVPCSGTGVIKRKPDTKWKLQPAYLENVQNIQAEIIRTYSKMLKRGGKMVYATCSILPSENERQVEAFLNESTDYQLLEQHRILPKNGSDAYYMALIEKK